MQTVLDRLTTPSATKAIHVERNVPLPRPRSTYPFSEMAIGDSFYIAGQSTQGAAVVAARAYGTRHGLKFAARVMPGGVRIWRMA